MAGGLPSSYLVEIEFSAGSGTFVDVTAYADLVVGARCGRGRTTPFDDIPAGTFEITLWNSDGRFTPDNPLSPYYPNVVEGRRIRFSVTKGASTSRRFFGRITSWRPNFGDGEPNNASVTVNATNVFGGAMLRTELSEWTERNAAAVTDLWPFTESGRVPTAFASAHSRTPDLAIVEHPTGAGNLQTGDAPDQLAVDGSLTITAEDSVGPVVIAASSFLFYTQAQYVFALRINETLQSGDPDKVIMLASTEPLTNYINPVYIFRIEVSWQSNKTRLRIVDPNLSVTTTLLANVNPAQWIVLRIRNDGTNDYVDLYTMPGLVLRTSVLLDGALSSTFQFVFGGFLTGSTKGKATQCSNIDVATILGTGDATNFLSLLDPLASVASQTRVGTIASYAGLTSTITGAPNRNVTVDKAGPAGELLSRVARTRGAIVDVDYANTNGEKAFNYYDASLNRLSTVAMTLDVDADLQGDLPMSRGAEGVPTRCSVTWNGGTVTLVKDETYQRIDSSVGCVAPSAADAKALAGAVLAQPRGLRMEKVRLDLVNATTDWYATCFALRTGSRVRVSNLPSALFGYTYVDGYIEGWTETYQVDSVEWAFDMSPADAPVEGAFDSNEYGRFSADGKFTVTGGTCVGTTTTGTIVITTATSGLYFTTSAGAYPCDLDWNGERITIGSAPAAGSGSTQTLTVTARGVAPSVARVHASGETIDVWHAAAFAY